MTESNPSPDGRTPASTIAQGQDITDLKGAEKALRESERRFREMLENIELIAVILDTEGRVTFCNDYLLRLTGRSRADVLGQSWFAMFVPPELRVDDIFGAWIKQNAIIPHLENEILTTSGERHLISWNNTIFRDAEGRIIGTTSIGEDITERKRAEERTQRLARELLVVREKERQQVSSALHHDLGSLAVGIPSHLDAIEEDIRSGKPGGALMWMKRTRKLCAESVARLKGVAIEIRPPELDVLGLCAALRQHFSQMTECGHTRIHFRENLGRRRVDGDTATILFRVAQEALTNAISHGNAKRVDVSLRALKKSD